MATRAEIDRWIHAQGGPEAVAYGYEDLDVDNPAFNNPDHPDYRGRTQTPDKIKTRRETWTNRTTGATFSAVRTPYADDQFQDIKETPGTKAPAAAAAQAKPPETKDEGGRRWVWRPNPGGPEAGGQWVDVGPAPLTPAERAAQQAATGTSATGTGAPEIVNGRAVRRVKRVTKDAQGNETVVEDLVDAQTGQPVVPQPKTGGGRTAVAGRPGVYVSETVDPVTGFTTKVYTNEQGVEIPAPTEPGTSKPVPGHPGLSTVTEYNPQTNRTETFTVDDRTGQRVQTPSAYTPLPPGVAPFTPDFTQVDLGLGARKRYLEELVRNGTITGEQLVSTIVSDGGTAKAAGENLGAVVNIQEGARAADLTARGQDITDASSRRNFASSTFNQTMSSLAPIAAQFVPGPGAGEAAAKGFAAMLGMARAHADAAGGMAAPRGFDPRQYPMLEGFGRAGVPGLPGGPPAGSWFPGLPGTPPPPPPPPPAAAAAGALPGAVPPGPAANALGLGAIGTLPAPGGPAAPALPPPIFRPQPPVPLPLPGPPPGAAPPPAGLPLLPGQTPAPSLLPGPAPAAGQVTIRRRPGTGGVDNATMTIPASAWEQMDPLWKDLYEGPGSGPSLTPPPAPVPGSPMGATLRGAWGQQAGMGYQPSWSGLDQDLLRSGFEPDVVGMVFGRM